MKKFKFIILSIFCFTSFILAGCNHSSITTNFIRFDIGQRQADYYLDFTIKFENKTNKSLSIEGNDFYVEINHEEKHDIGLLYDNEEIYYGNSITLNKNETLSLRVRAISPIKERDYNSILIKYKNKVLVEDNIYIYNKQ